MRYIVAKGEAARRPELWRQAVSETYFELETEYRNRAEFSGSLEAWSLGQIGVSRNVCDGLLYRRQRRHFLNERDASLLITIPEMSEVTFTQGARTTKCAPGAFLVERGDAPYEFHHGRMNALWVMKVPTSSVRARIGAAERLGALSFDATEGIGALFVDTLKTAISHVETLDARTRDVMGLHILDLLCLAIRADHRVLDSETSSVRAGHLHRAEQFIRDNLKDPDLGPRAVADSCGISLRYLQRLFSDTGQSVNGYIREARLTRCAEDLASPSQTRSVAEIAYRWGFADQSQFSKHYRARFGCTARDTRRAAQDGVKLN